MPYYYPIQSLSWISSHPFPILMTFLLATTVARPDRIPHCSTSV